MEIQSNPIFFLLAVAHEYRIKIIQSLLKNPGQTPTELGTEFYLQQSSISHHLRILFRARIVYTKKLGRNLNYYLNPNLKEILIKNLNEIFQNEGEIK